MKPSVHNFYHKTAPPGSVYIGRGSPFGNDFIIGDPHPDTGVPMTRDDVCDLFCERTLPNIDVSALSGKDLVCFCKPKRCHGDSILMKANKMNFERSALEYICRAGSGATVSNFMDDHAPVGNEILESLKAKGFVVVSGEEIKMTMRGFDFLATRWK